MAFPPQRPRQWFTIRGSLLLPLLAVTLLVPVAILFVQLHQIQADKEAFAKRERHGIEYLRSLYQVTTALMDAESAAVAGRSISSDALTRAVNATTAVDDRLGDELSTRDRWSGVRAKIEALPSRNAKDPETSYSAYGETADLLVALYSAVREESDLIRDPDADSYFLGDGVGEELPQALVGAGRLADLAVLAPARSSGQHNNTIADLSSAKDDVSSPVHDLSEDLQAAVNGTSSQTLSGTLLSRLDLYQRNMDALTTATSPLGANQLKVDTTKVATLRTEVQTAAAALGDALFTELDGLVSKRLNDVTSQSRIATGATTAAVLLALAAIAASVLSRRRLAANRGQTAAAPSATVAAGNDQSNQRGIPPRWPDPGPNGGNGPEPGTAYPVGPEVVRADGRNGDEWNNGAATGWERSGAAR
jgi:hypothetical protein